MTLLKAFKMLFDLLLSREKVYAVIGKVTDVDETARTCTVEPIDDSPELFDVRLQSSESLADGMVLIPTVGSFVTVSFINKTTGIIVNTSEIDKILINTDLVQFNDGANDGMILINELTDKINRLEDKLKSHQHGYIPYPSGVAGTPVTTTVATALVPPDTTLIFTNSVKSDYENTKITQ